MTATLGFFFTLAIDALGLLHILGTALANCFGNFTLPNCLVTFDFPRNALGLLHMPRLF
jgi:hypothetical protein